MIRKIVSAALPVITSMFKQDCCLNASRVLIEVCRELGHPARPLAVEAVAMNAEWVAFLAEHERTPEQGECPGAWALGCLGPQYMSENGYEGHVVVWTQGHLVDLSAAQFSRPDRSIKTPEAIVARTPAAWERGEINLALPMPDGAVLSYLALPRERAFEDTPGFARSAHNLEAARQIRARLLALA